ncbi:MAG: hypothetical protein ACJAUQ_000526, partial [Maribacter sp.]
FQIQLINRRKQKVYLSDIFDFQKIE